MVQVVAKPEDIVKDPKGLIIALEDDQKIKRALAATNNIECYRYQIDFKLVRSS
jgi:restriction system protein